jgi:hypothetical protein
MKLVDDWRKAWRFLSIQINALCASAAVIWTTLNSDQQNGLLSWLGLPPSAYVAGAFGLATIARLIAQPKLEQRD